MRVIRFKIVGTEKLNGFSLKSFWEWLVPREAERDEGFRQEVLSLSHRGIPVVGGIEVLIAVLSFLGFMRWPAGLVILVMGVATATTLRTARAYLYTRWGAAMSTGVAATVASYEIARGRSEDFAVASTAVLMLASVVVPLLPLQSLAIGIAVVVAGLGSAHLGFLVMMALASTAITATLYAQRRANYLSYLGVIRASQDLRSRLLISESSNTMVRMSAALAHELSNPLGAATSAISSLLLVSGRLAHGTPEDQKRLLVLQGELSRSLHDSMGRLKRMVNRIQRLTVLNEAPMRPANVNDIVREAVAMVESEASGVRFEVALQPVPEILCRPQQLLDVFSNLLMNSIQALDGDGRIEISTRLDDSKMEINIQDNGRGISPSKLAHIFDPAFQAADGRISTGNWTLFTSRQFVKDHGGEMHIESREGSGTTVSVILPC